MPVGRVFRRVGGLEESYHNFGIAWDVFRRVGGLEGPRVAPLGPVQVFRRVGGLEECPSS